MRVSQRAGWGAVDLSAAQKGRGGSAGDGKRWHWLPHGQAWGRGSAETADSLGGPLWGQLPLIPGTTTHTDLVVH